MDFLGATASAAVVGDVTSANTPIGGFGFTMTSSGVDSDFASAITKGN